MLGKLLQVAEKDNLAIPPVRLRIRNPAPSQLENIPLAELDQKQLIEHALTIHGEQTKCVCRQVGTISISCADTPLMTFLNYLALGAGLSYERRKDVYIIGPEELLGDHPRHVRSIYVCKEEAMKTKLKMLPKHLPRSGEGIAFDSKNGYLVVIAPFGTGLIFEQLLTSIGVELVATSIQAHDF